MRFGAQTPTTRPDFVLLADGRRGHAGAGLGLPDDVAVASVERIEPTIAHADIDTPVRHRGPPAGDGDVGDAEMPLLLARVGVKRMEFAIA